MLKVAQAKKDSAKIIEYARFLFLYNFNPKQDYYEILKNIIETENWYSFLEEIIKEIKQTQRWNYNELVEVYA